MIVSITKTTPKVFISYSWTNPEHEKWVIELAEGLVKDGVHVLLDKWDWVGAIISDSLIR